MLLIAKSVLVKKTHTQKERNLRKKTKLPAFIPKSEAVNQCFEKRMFRSFRGKISRWSHFLETLRIYACSLAGKFFKGILQDDSPETLRKLCVSTKFPHDEN